MALPSLTSSGLAEAVVEIAKLAQKAQLTSLDTIKIDGLGLGPGLPSEVPVELLQNQAPLSLRNLIEEWRQAPARWKGTAQVTNLQSFIGLVNRHKNVEGSTIFARTSWPNPSLTAIIDYDAADHAPLHRQHRINYPFPVSEEFAAWISNDGKKLTQQDFAEFLEERAADLAAPGATEQTELEQLFKATIATPLELMELSRGLSVNVGQKVANHTKLQSGEGEISFFEEHTNSAGEKLVVPGVFIIALPAFLDGEPIRVPVRLRYRVIGGDIVWIFKLYRWEMLLRERVQGDLAIAAAETDLPPFEGEPEPAQG